MSSLDETAAQIIAAKAITTIDDVITVMQGLDRVLFNGDGLKWFNLLYLKVTEAVRDNPAAGKWENPNWLERLDVVFAKLYFAAIANWQSERRNVARAWVPLFEARPRRDIMRVQFALAGMNAHINHDLPIALVQTDKELGVVPRRGTPEHRDFERVNEILEAVEERVKPYIATGIVGEIDQDLGRIDDVLAMWKVRRARETSWLNAELLWRLLSIPIRAAGDEFLVSLDRLVSLGSRGLLIPAGKLEK
jgi:uncharacterized protein DUF5995